MKTLQNQKFQIIDLVSAVRRTSVDVNAMTVVKNGTYWVNVVISMLPSIGLQVTRARVRAIVVTFKRFSLIARSQGIRGLVIYLKACDVLFAQATAGHTIKDSGLLSCRVSRTNRGIPRIIIASDRLRLRQNDYAVEIFWHSVFNLFRILSFKGKLKLSTITAPFKGHLGFITESLVPLIPHFVTALYAQSRVNLPREGGITWVGINKYTTPGRPAAMSWLLARYANLNPLWLAKSASGTHHEGIQVSSHPILMIRTIASLMRSPVWENFTYFISLMPVNAPFRRAFNFCKEAAPLMKPLFALGKLGLKEEAAGKVRVFAMAPTWIQLMLAPVHDFIFMLLEKVPQDGTFNQLGPLKDHSEKARVKGSWSLDLTAATDRLPLVLQVHLLAELVGCKELAIHWSKLLTGIEYSLNNPHYGVSGKFKYTVGQPMGALSSWPMLAVTHHFLVQSAAWISGVVPVGTWFKDYAILGDDMVVFDELVAIEYRRIIRLIGMDIGLHKSILSKAGTVVEFAKRLFHNGIDVSARPFKEYFASLAEIGNILEYKRKYGLSEPQLARALGFKYQALSKIGNGFECLPSKLKQLNVAAALPTNAEEVANFLQLGAPVKAKWPISLEVFWKQFTSVEFRRLLKSMNSILLRELNNLDSFPHLGNKVIESPEVTQHVSPKFHVPIGPWDAFNWAKGPVQMRDFEAGYIPGPAEAKEISKGFILLGCEFMQPIEVLNEINPFRDSVNMPNSVLNLNEEQWMLLRQAFAALFDAHILPRREKLLEANREVQHAIAKGWMLPEDMQQVFITFLEISREAALVPSKAVSFIRTAPLSRHSDPVSLRMWRKWSKLIQGTVRNGAKSIF